MTTKTYEVHHNGIIFPGIIMDGVLYDSRTGKRVMLAECWNEISTWHFKHLCRKWGIVDCSSQPAAPCDKRRLK